MEDLVLFLVAHNDDQIIGAGGTIAKYAKEGIKVVTIIFSFGEVSLPHMQEKESRKTRVKESKRAAKILGEEETYFLGLTENKFSEEIENKDIKSKIQAIIERTQPSKIFTHSIDDPHPDHRSVYKFTLDLVDEIDYKGEVFSFNIWNFFINFRRRDLPRMAVDITDTFKKKVEAFKKHKSQAPAMLFHMWSIYFQAFMHGLNNNCKYAEVFYKIR
jgi:LmbE family N-acetylglucosaminyl deacetylase